MPRRYSRYTRRTRKARKPLRRLARRAQYKRGARAQSRQIRTIARHLSTLKHDVRKDLTQKAIWGQSLVGALKTTSAEVTDVIIPLTCGVASDAQHTPMTNLNNVSHTGWDPLFQPRELAPALDGTQTLTSVPPWLKVYNQTVSLRFWSGTVPQPTVITVSCVRVNNKAVSNIKGIASRLDGENHEGPDPDVTNAPAYIRRGIDYACSPGVTFSAPAAAGNPPTQVTSNPNGSVDLHWNNQLYTVEYQKTFVLGGMPNPDQAHVNELNPLPSKSLTAPASVTPDANQGMEVCKFSVNYGGMKLSGVPPLDDTSEAFAPQHVSSTTYANIPAEHKRWLVISSSDPQVGASNYAPYFQMNSIISTTVPT